MDSDVAGCNVPILTFSDRRHLTEHDHRRGVGLIIYPNRLCNIAAHRSATKTKEESISILSRSGNRYLLASIAWKCNFSRWRPILRRNTKIRESELIDKLQRQMRSGFRGYQCQGIDPF